MVLQLRILLVPVGVLLKRSSKELPRYDGGALRVWHRDFKASFAMTSSIIVLLANLALTFTLAEYAIAGTVAPKCNKESGIRYRLSSVESDPMENLQIGNDSYNKIEYSLHDNREFDKTEGNLNVYKQQGDLVIRPPGRERPYSNVYEFEGQQGDVLDISVESSEFVPVVWMLDRDGSSGVRVLAGSNNPECRESVGFTTIVSKNGDHLLAVNSYGRSGQYRVQIRKKIPLSPNEDVAILEPSESPSRAILIGVDDYPGFKNDLKGPVNDVATMKNFLIKKAGFDAQDILELKDWDATISNIEIAIKNFLKPLPEDSTVLFYFSGHGIPRFPNRNNPEALLLADGSLLTDQKLKELLDREIQTINIMVVLDACHSEGMMSLSGQGDLRPKSPYFEEGQQAEIGEYFRSTVDESKMPVSDTRKNFYWYAASKEDQKAWESDKIGEKGKPGGVFTHFFVKKISEILSSTEEFMGEGVDDAILDEVQYYSKAEGGEPQSPVSNLEFKNSPVHKMFGLSSPPTATGQPTNYAESHALLVAVQEYEGEGLLLDEKIIMQEISGIKNALEKYHHFDVNILKDPTKKKLENALETFAEEHGAKSDNRLFLYFLGHGVTVLDRDNIPLGYFLSHDAKRRPPRRHTSWPPKDWSDYRTELEEETAVSMKYIRDLFKEVKSTQVLLVFNSCFSGLIKESRRPLRYGEKAPEKARPYITAGRGDESAELLRDFGGKFVDIISSPGARNRFLTAKDVGIMLSHRFLKFFRERNREVLQSPQYGDLLRMDGISQIDEQFVFLKPSSL